MFKIKIRFSLTVFLFWTANVQFIKILMNEKGKSTIDDYIQMI